MGTFEVILETVFELIAFVLTLFPFFMFVFIFCMIAKISKNAEKNSNVNMNIDKRNYEGIIRAGERHYHKGSVGSTRKDEEWEETRCQKYKEEAFGKDTCGRYTKPDYDSLTCEDEDLSGG